MTWRRLTTRCALCALLAVLPVSAARAADSPYAEGLVLKITGAVTDAAGTPQVGKTVELEAYRSAFSFNPRQMGKARKGLVQRTTTTDASGRYTLEWVWYDYFNRFELSVGDFGEEGWEVLEKADISRRMLRGSPVVVSFIIGRDSATTSAPQRPVATPGVEPTRSPPASTPSADPARATGSPAQEQIRVRQGAPDLVDTLELPYGTEATWWYYELGKAYRFLDGELRAEMTFDPVRSD